MRDDDDDHHHPPFRLRSCDCEQNCPQHRKKTFDEYARHVNIYGCVYSLPLLPYLNSSKRWRRRHVAVRLQPRHRQSHTRPRPRPRSCRLLPSNREPSTASSKLAAPATSPPRRALSQGGEAGAATTPAAAAVAVAGEDEMTASPEPAAAAAVAAQPCKLLRRKSGRRERPRPCGAALRRLACRGGRERQTRL